MPMREKKLMGKDELNKVLRDNIEKVTGLTISLTDAWNIFKICIYTPFDLSNKKDVRVSIPKVGVFTTSKALDSYKKGADIRPKFYGSSGMTDLMTEGESLVSTVMYSYTSKAECKKSKKAKAVKKVKVTEEPKAVEKPVEPKKVVKAVKTEVKKNY